MEFEQDSDSRRREFHPRRNMGYRDLLSGISVSVLEQWLTFPVFFPFWFHQGECLNKVPISLNALSLTVSPQGDLVVSFYLVAYTNFQVSWGQL